jgi:hypothetical protein
MALVAIRTLPPPTHPVPLLTTDRFKEVCLRMDPSLLLELFDDIVGCCTHVSYTDIRSIASGIRKVGSGDMKLALVLFIVQIDKSALSVMYTRWIPKGRRRDDFKHILDGVMNAVAYFMPRKSSRGIMFVNSHRSSELACHMKSMYATGVQLILPPSDAVPLPPPPPPVIPIPRLGATAPFDPADSIPERGGPERGDYRGLE